MDNKMNNKNEQNIGQAIALSYAAIVLINVYNVMAPEFVWQRENVSAGIKIIMLLFIIKCIPVIFKRISIWEIQFILSSIVFSIFNVIFFPETKQYFIGTMVDFFSMPFIVALLLLCCRDYKYVETKIYLYSRICSLIILYIDFFYITNINSSNYRLSYFMGLSNALILPTIFLMYRIVKESKIVNLVIDLAFVIGNIMFILIKGSRGALLTIIIGCVVVFIKHKGGKFITYIIGMFSFTLALFWREIIENIAIFLNARGIITRTLNLLLTNATYSSSRDKLQTKLIGEIIRHPLEVRGINADYVVNGIYAHNLFLELIYDFGIIVGGIIIAIIIFLAIKTLFLKCKNDEENIILILFLSSFPLLMLSSSLFVNISFGPWLLICLKNQTESKKIIIRWRT